MACVPQFRETFRERTKILILALGWSWWRKWDPEKCHVESSSAHGLPTGPSFVTCCKHTSVSTEGAVTILLIKSLLAAQSDMIKYSIILLRDGQKTLKKMSEISVVDKTTGFLEWAVSIAQKSKIIEEQSNFLSVVTTLLIFFESWIGTLVPCME